MAIPHPATRVHLLALTALCPALVSGEGDTGAAQKGNSYTLKLQQLLEPFGITKFYTDGWGAYERHIDAETHQVGKENTQKIESKHINLRTRIKRLVRRTLCFSKTEQMHDLV